MKTVTIADIKFNFQSVKYADLFAEIAAKNNNNFSNSELVLRKINNQYTLFCDEQNLGKFNLKQWGNLIENFG